MIFVFIRHGNKHDDPNDDGELTDKGREQACRMGRFLDSKGLRPTVAVRTKKKRTQQTMEIVLQELGVKCPEIVQDSAFDSRSDQEAITVRVRGWAAESGIAVSTMFFCGHCKQQTAIVNKFRLAPVKQKKRVVLVIEIDDKGKWRELDRYVDAGDHDEATDSLRTSP
jgi:phosphohistidine phosphatase SixA